MWVSPFSASGLYQSMPSNVVHCGESSLSLFRPSMLPVARARQLVCATAKAVVQRGGQQRTAARARTTVAISLRRLWRYRGSVPLLYAKWGCQSSLVWERCFECIPARALHDGPLFAWWAQGARARSTN